MARFRCNPSHAPRIVIFDLNQARRVKVITELEAVRSAFLDWPTVKGSEESVDKVVEHGEMMEDHVTDLLQAVIREQFVIGEGLERAAKLAEECSL